MRRAALCAAIAATFAVACRAGEPPGRHSTDPHTSTVARPTTFAASVVASSAPHEEGPSPEDEPGHGAKIGSIAMRTWVYDEPRDGSRKLGYLRAGAAIDRAERSAGADGCEGGWYRVAPRGYVCVGKGATLDLDDPIVQAAPHGPRRGEPTPYLYVMSSSPPPHFYFRLPSEGDQTRVEGPTVKTHIIEHRGLFSTYPADPVPPFLLDGHDLPIPYGSNKDLSYSVHRGSAKESSAFGLITTFDWTERRFGLTTELDLIPLDRTKPAIISKIHGVKIEDGGRPAFVLASGTTRYRKRDTAIVADGPAEPRSGWELTGQTQGGENGLVETTEEGVWLPAQGLVIGEPRKGPRELRREGPQMDQRLDPEAAPHRLRRHTTGLRGARFDGARRALRSRRDDRDHPGDVSHSIEARLGDHGWR